MTPDQMKHFVSLDLAQKMKAAGFPQDGTPFVWMLSHFSGKWECRARVTVDLFSDSSDWCAAPIATEIEFNRYLNSDEEDHRSIKIIPADSECYIVYMDNMMVIPDNISVASDTEPNARAMMWLSHPETRKEG